MDQLQLKLLPHKLTKVEFELTTPPQQKMPPLVQFGPSVPRLRLSLCGTEVAEGRSWSVRSW